MGVYTVVPSERLRAKSRLAKPAAAGGFLLEVDPAIDLTGCDCILIEDAEQVYFATDTGVATKRIVIHKNPLKKDYPAGTTVTGGCQEQIW